MTTAKTQTPVPRRMRALQRDHRGYPVPFTVQRDRDNRPLFAVNDSIRHRRCVIERRCPICGNRLDKLIWFVGGPRCAFHEHGVYVDSGMHYDCMEYALKVCPYLAMRPYGKPPLEKIAGRLPDNAVFEDPTVIPGTPKVFVAVAVTEYSYQDSPTQLYYSRPARPYLAVEYWRGGVKVDRPDDIEELSRRPVQ